MVYPRIHQYLTVHWEVAAATLEHGQFGLRFDSLTPPTVAELEDAAEVISAFWSTSGVAIPSYYRLTGLKSATIGVDGKYPDESEPLVYDYPAPVAGGGTNVRQFPLQIAHAASLLTAAVRGRAHRGRIYLPPLAQNLDNSDQWPVSVVQPRCDGLWIMLQNLDVIMPGDLSVFSKIGLGTQRDVTSIAVGTRPDVQRRRAAQLEEFYVLPTP